MVDSSEIMDRLNELNFQRQSLGVGAFAHEPSTSGQLSKIAEYQAEVAMTVRPDSPIDLHIPAFREYTDDGTNNTETVSLNHDLADTPAVGEDVVVYRGGTKISPAAVRYGADEIDIDTNGNDEDYYIWYLSGEQARVVLRIVAPRNFQNDIVDRDLGLANKRNQGRDPITVDLNGPLEGAVPTDYKLEWYVDAPYPVNYSPAGTAATADNTLLLVPINRGSGTVDGLEALKRAAMASEG